MMAKPNGFDLSKYNTVDLAESGSILKVLSPDTFEPLIGSDGQQITIRLAGVDSATFRRAKNRATNRRLSQARGQKTTAERLESESIELLADCTLEWSMNFNVDGTAMECNRDNAMKLYTRFPWLKEQVDEFIGDRANFLHS